MKKQPWDLAPEDVLPALLAMIADKGPRRRTRKELERSADRRRKTLWRRRVRRVRERAARERAERAARRGPPAARNARGMLVRHPVGAAVHDRMIAGMAPGEWYGQNDIVRMAGMGREWRGKIHQVLLPRGLIEQARNPAWQGALRPQRIFAGEVPEPMHVYRLTARGAALRETVLLLGLPELAGRDFLAE